MIKTKSVYDDKEDSDGIRILVARYCLSGIRRKNFDTWYSELSPSKSLLKNFKDGKMSQNIFFQFFYSNYYRYYMSGLDWLLEWDFIQTINWVFGWYYINDLRTSQYCSTTSNAIVEVNNFHSRHIRP
ncbi:MAG: hypothetical protein QOD16_02580 [Nitrososphaeraceae archaeon]|nr:hypothetical protein [Nitrososphaeraceae archaeon]